MRIRKELLGYINNKKWNNDPHLNDFYNYFTIYVSFLYYLEKLYS